MSVLLITHIPNSFDAFEEVGGFVARCIVDDDDLESDRCLGGERFEAFKGQLRTVEERRNDTDRGLLRGGKRPTLIGIEEEPQILACHLTGKGTNLIERPDGSLAARHAAPPTNIL